MHSLAESHAEILAEILAENYADGDALSSDLRQQFPLLSETIQGHPLAYLDSAATTPMPQPVIDALVHFETHCRANIERSSHTLACRATDAYQLARQQVASYLGVEDAEQIVFSSGATASINLVAQGLAEQLRPGDEILVSAAEHHSNLIPWQRLRDTRGIILKTIPLTSEGRLDLAGLDKLLTSRCRLIAVTHASNVTGAITDVQSIVRAARRVGAWVLLDGAQAAAHGPLDLPALGVDFYAFSGHKCFGPTGVGVLWGRAECLQVLTPLKVGGGMVEAVTLEQASFKGGYRRFEAGTPPIAQAVALGAALEWLQGLPWHQLREQQRRLSKKLLSGLRAVPGLRLLGPGLVDAGSLGSESLGRGSLENRLPIFSFEIEGMHSHDICHLLDQRGVALRGGKHCAQPLHAAFDMTATSRASIGLFNNTADIDALLEGLWLARKILL